MLVHGGLSYTGVSARTDTWALSVAGPGHWDELGTTGLQLVRVYGGALVDPEHDRLVVGPASSSQYPPPASELDSYELPLAAGGEWRVAPAAHPFTPSQLTYVVVHDTRRPRMITIGNRMTHALSLTDGSGWQRLWPPDPPAAPDVLSGNVLVSDASHQAIWSVGGSEAAGFDDLWKLDAGGGAQWTWYPLGDQLPPSGLAAVLDAAGQRILGVHSGYPGAVVKSIDIAGGPAVTAFEAQGVSPPPRVDHTVVLDPVRRQLVLFGGQIFLAHFSGHSYDDVWTLPLDDLTTWTEQTPSGPTPPARGSHFAFYDDLHDRMVVFGGWQQGGGPIRHFQHDAWALSLAGTPTWAALSGPAWDPPVEGRITYDAVNRRLYLFHGASLESPGATLVYTRGTDDGDAWTLLDTSGDPPLFDGPIALALWADRLVVVSTNRDGPQSDETWALQIDHAVPALASLESVDSSPEHVAIAWRLGDSNGGAVALARRAGDDPWRTLRLLMPDGEGRVAYDDRDVAPGQLLGYRLSDGARTLIETTVRVPERTPLAFAGACPSPARGAAHLAFTLPAASPVTLDLYDVRGARVLSRELGVQPAGAHEWTWPETSTLRPGLYLARLTTSAGRRDARVVMLP